MAVHLFAIFARGSPRGARGHHYVPSRELWHQPGANRFSSDHTGLDGVGSLLGGMSPGPVLRQACGCFDGHVRRRSAHRPKRKDRRGASVLGGRPGRRRILGTRLTHSSRKQRRQHQLGCCRRLSCQWQGPARKAVALLSRRHRSDEKRTLLWVLGWLLNAATAAAGPKPAPIPHST